MEKILVLSAVLWAIGTLVFVAFIVFAMFQVQKWKSAYFFLFHLCENSSIEDFLSSVENVNESFLKKNESKLISFFSKILKKDLACHQIGSYLSNEKYKNLSPNKRYIFRNSIVLAIDNLKNPTLALIILDCIKLPIIEWLHEDNYFCTCKLMNEVTTEVLLNNKEKGEDIKVLLDFMIKKYVNSTSSPEENKKVEIMASFVEFKRGAGLL